MIEILAAANGWLVKPGRYDRDGTPFNQVETFVFNNAADLAKHVAEWGKKELEITKKHCTCK